MAGFSASVRSLEASSVMWTGRSGRRYQMRRIAGDREGLAPGQFYALAENGVICWAGTAEDLIGDQDSRAKFRRASGKGTHLMSMAAPTDPLAAMTLVWDLEGAHFLSGRFAA